MEVALLKKFEYDPEVYNAHTIKRQFKKQKLEQIIQKYNMVEEIHFAKQTDDLSDGEEFIGPVFLKPFELLILLRCMVQYPPVYLKLIQYNTLCKFLIEISKQRSDLLLYPLCYVKLYLPECDKVRILLKAYNPFTDYTKFLVTVIKTEGRDIEKQIVEYSNSINKKYASGELDFNTISRTLLDVNDAVDAITEGW